MLLSSVADLALPYMLSNVGRPWLPRRGQSPRSAISLDGWAFDGFFILYALRIGLRLNPSLNAEKGVLSDGTLKRWRA